MPATAVTSVKAASTLRPPCTAVSSVTVKVSVSPSSSLTSSTVTAALSSSVIVTLSPWTVRLPDVPSTLRVSSPSKTASLVGVRSKVALPLVFPALMVTSKSVTAS